MKRVIRSRTTGLYFAEAGEWTEHVQKAKEFSGILQAIEALQRGQLRDCDLVLQAEIVLPPNTNAPVTQ